MPSQVPNPTTMAPPKVEVNQNCEQKDGEQNNGEKNTLTPIQQSLQVIQNKIRNLEKRKVSSKSYLMRQNIQIIDNSA